MPTTIRFSELVQKAGRPYAATLWTNPARDPAFQKAVKENRVVTVKQETVGSKKDFGTFGFSREKNVSYFVFPRKLSADPQARVVGIKYDLLDQPKPRDPISKNVARPLPSPLPRGEGEPVPAKIKNVARPHPGPLRRGAGERAVAKKKPAPPVPREKEFVATVKRTATWETALRVKAANKAEAKRRAEEAIGAQKFLESEAVVRNEIRSVEEI